MSLPTCSSVPSVYEEVHFCSLQSQSNVYGLASLSPTAALSKVLVASIRGKVISLEFQKSVKSTPSSKEIHFTYIPGDAEIVSIDTFTKPAPSLASVVGITFIKTNEGKRNQFLNIYSHWEPGGAGDLDRIAQACDTHELNFIPYQLLHAEIVSNCNREAVFLLSGSDHVMHMYRENRISQAFIEDNVKEYFPEFCDIGSSITWVDIQNRPDENERVTAFGCQNGTISVNRVDMQKNSILSSWTLQHDGPITSLQIFTLNNSMSCPNYVPEDYVEEEGRDKAAGHLHLVVTDALEVAVVYRNILEKGLEEPLILHESDQYDSVLCCCVADVDFDGQKEILLGTYGQELLAYKLVHKNTSPNHSLLEEQRKGGNKDTSPEKASLQSGEFRLLWRRSFAYPLLALRVLDITGDGVEEIMVLSLQGLHVLKQNVDEVATICLNRLKLLSHQTDTEEDDIFQQLQSEHFGEDP